MRKKRAQMEVEMKILQGKKIIVVGGSRGIGEAAVRECLAAGAHVGVTYASSRSRMEAMEQEFAGGDTVFFCTHMDITSPDSVREGIKELIGCLGGVDVLINNAGITRDRAFPFMDEENWEDVLQTNLTGAYRTARQVVPPMAPHKNGVIINVSSVSGIIGMPGQTNYSASKAGMIGLTRSLSKELGRYNIRVNAVAPGFVETEMVEELDEGARQDAIAKIPLGRFATPEEIAHLLVFLSSDHASYINGETIVIDGGLS